MLVIDDGSDDGTPDIVEAIGDERIRVLRCAHQGIEKLDAIYNHGLAEARGDLIAILEGDDLWHSHKLDVQMPHFENEGVVLSGGRIEIQSPHIPPTIAPTDLPDDQALLNQPVGASAFAMLHPWILTFTFALTVMVRSKTLQEIGGFRKLPYLPVVDYPTFLEVALKGEWRFEKEPLGVWRRHGQSVTGARFAEILSGAYKYAAEFFAQNATLIPHTQATIAKLDLDWRLMQLHRLELAGRMKSGTGQRKHAAKYFQRAAEIAPSRRIKLLLHVAAALTRFGISPESLFRKARRGPWQEETKIFGDSIVDPEHRPEDYAYRSFTSAGTEAPESQQ